jgi:hypothetical protein
MNNFFRGARILVLLLAVFPAASFLDNRSKAGKTPSDVPVTSTIDGLGADTLPTLRVQSDQLGAYKTIGSGKSVSLQSIIQGLGDWELDMLNFTSSPQRKVLIDLRDSVPGSGPNGGAPINPFGATGYQTVRARFISKCSENGINFLTMETNTPYFCPLALAFDDTSGVRYRLAENPINFSETNWVQVTCLATAAGKCNQWKIEPSVFQMNGEQKNVAKLLKVATKPRETDQDMGDFYLSFTIHVTNP